MTVDKAHSPRVIAKTDRAVRSGLQCGPTTRGAVRAGLPFPAGCGGPVLGVHLACRSSVVGVAGKYTTTKSLSLTLAVIGLDTHLVHDLSYVWHLKKLNS